MYKVIRKILKYPRLTLDYPMKKVDSALFATRPKFDAGKCIKCGECIRRCPSFAIAEDGSGGAAGINYDECIF